MSNQNWWNKPVTSKKSSPSLPPPPAKTKKSSWWNKSITSRSTSPTLPPPAKPKKSSWWNKSITSRSSSPTLPPSEGSSVPINNKGESYKKYGTILIWSIVLIALIGGGYFCYKYIKLKKITNDKDSNKRMDNLVNSLESILGTRWRGILCTFLILCMFTIFILYLLSKKDSTITLSDRQFEVLEVTGIFIASVITIVVTGATIYMVYNHYKQKNSIGGQNNNFETKDTNQKQTFEVIGLAVGIILIISILIGYFVHHRKKIQQFHQKSAN